MSYGLVLSEWSNISRTMQKLKIYLLLTLYLAISLSNVEAIPRLTNFFMTKDVGNKHFSSWGKNQETGVHIFLCALILSTKRLNRDHIMPFIS